MEVKNLQSGLFDKVVCSVIFFRIVISVLFIFIITPYFIYSEELSQPFNTNSMPIPNNFEVIDTYIWRGGKIGDGFITGTQTISLNLGMTYGVLLFGGDERHDIVPLSIAYGYMLGDVKGKNSWYKGNIELRVELLGGYQVNVESDLSFGITPHFRYHFATGESWIPYIDVGVGLMLTEIRAPDLGAAFQFNEQLASGLNYFVKDNFAINFEVRYIHISSASLSEPNKGVNTIGGFIGANWFF